MGGNGERSWKLDRKRDSKGEKQNDRKIWIERKRGLVVMIMTNIVQIMILLIDQSIVLIPIREISTKR